MCRRGLGPDLKSPKNDTPVTSHCASHPISLSTHIANQAQRTDGHVPGHPPRSTYATGATGLDSSVRIPRRVVHLSDSGFCSD